MEIEYLLEQYFEGHTDAKEEAQLRRFFTSGEVPEHLLMYRPLFVYFDDEIRRSKAVEQPEMRRSPVVWLSGVAACAAILIGSFIFVRQTECRRAENYVMIDGRCYTDEATIRSATLKSLHSVFEDDILISGDQQADASEIIENQLKEFDFLLK